MTSRSIRRLLLCGAATFVLPSGVSAQDGPQWERRSDATVAPLSVFPSTRSVDLPTAQTLGAGELLFEIAHRFAGPIEGGSETFWGLDQGARMRIGLHWAPTSRLMVGVTRSDVDDNVELGGKARLGAVRGPLDAVFAVQGGVAWNTEVAGGDDLSTTQTHAELVVDLGLPGGLGLGLVPGIVTNPDVRAEGEDLSFFLGTHARAELNDRVALIGQWVFAPERGDFAHDPGSFGIELETGGHFFKIVVGNALRLNPTQAFAGAALPFGTNHLRLGFNITRIIRF